jgi:three-Cys-motif partner protein
VQVIGEWAEEQKHAILRKFIEATRKVRRKYLPPLGPGGAAYLDLFAGPGRARVRETGAIVDGSPLIAAKNTAAPFSRLIFCDLDAANVAALRKRAEGDSRVLIIEGDCNKEIDRIVAEVPRYGLNLAFIDPYGLDALDFAIIEKLARSSDRMDLLIHYPTGAMKRNLGRAGTRALTKAKMTKALGTGVTAARPREVVREIDATLRKNLVSLGYTGKKLRSVPVENSKGVTMYHLVYASKHPLGDDIWESITRPKQGELPLG